MYGNVINEHIVSTWSIFLSSMYKKKINCYVLIATTCRYMWNIVSVQFLLVFVKSLYKNKGDSTSPENYRPIHLSFIDFQSKVEIDYITIICHLVVFNFGLKINKRQFVTLPWGLETSALHDSLFHVVYMYVLVLSTLFYLFFLCTHPHLIVILFVWNNYVLYIVYHFCVWFEKINKLEAWFWCCKKKNTNQRI